MAENNHVLDENWRLPHQSAGARPISPVGTRQFDVATTLVDDAAEEQSPDRNLKEVFYQQNFSTRFRNLQPEPGWTTPVNQETWYLEHMCLGDQCNQCEEQPQGFRKWVRQDPHDYGIPLEVPFKTVDHVDLPGSSWLPLDQFEAVHKELSDAFSAIRGFGELANNFATPLANIPSSSPTRHQYPTEKVTPPLLLPFFDRDNDFELLYPPTRQDKPQTLIGPNDGEKLEHEIPFTDSGYATAPLGDAKSTSGLRSSDKDNSDARTYISAATTVVPEVVQCSILEVCDDIYHRVKGHVEEDNKSLFDGMPDLIKEFAIRLNHLDPSGANRRIMHFVYSHHRVIASQLRQMFQAKLEDDEVTHRDWQGGMSVTEKMRLWASKPDDLDTTLVDVSECFQGVEEEVDERTSDPELPTFGRAILQSKAYEWLIQHLVKESSFCWGQGPRIMVDEIRSAILRGLPAGRISKNRDPDIHQAEFRMSLPQFSQRLLRDYQRTGNAWNWKDVSGAVVLVSSSDDGILATRVEEYIGQTWNKDMELLTRFWVALEQSFSDIDVVVGIPKTFSVFAEGVSYSIAEQGEQLAWLIAALQSPGNHETIFNSPSVIKRDAGIWELQVESTPGSDNHGGLSVLKRLGWLGSDKVMEPVIAHGFPTIRRPSSSFHKGVEISPSVLFSLIPVKSLVVRDGHTRLFGANQGLELVDETQGVCLWHVIPTGGKDCECRRSQELHIFKDIQQYRHVVDTCPDSDGLGSKKITTLPCAEPIYQKPPTLNVPFAVEALEYQHSSSDCQESSLDSEMMSIPDTQEAPVHEVPFHLSPAIDVAACRLIKDFNTLSNTGVANRWSSQSSSSDATTGLGAAPVNSRPQNETQQSHRRADPRSSNAAPNPPLRRHPQRTRKRAADEDKAEDEDDEQEYMRPSKKPRHGQNLPPNKALACPFWKLDPDSHRKCGRMDNFFQVNRVKQHLARSHAEPEVHCDKCKTIFQDEDAHLRHMQDTTCTFKPWEFGHRPITRRQQNELRKKSKAASEPERWFAIWHIVFPGHPPPASPYIDISMSEDMRRFREYATGPRVVGALRAAGLGELDSLTWTPEAVSWAIDLMFDGFALSRPSLNSSSGQSGSSRSELSGQEASLDSFADSGVALDNQGIGPPAQENVSLVRPAIFVPGTFFDENQDYLLVESASGPVDYQAIDNNFQVGADHVSFSISTPHVDGRNDDNEAAAPDFPGEDIGANNQTPPVGDHLGSNLADFTDFTDFGDNHGHWSAAEGELSLTDCLGTWE